ncbi:MAG: transporter substrate-binding domain-containing protein, partial [Gammaproteobacteria bacterium]|nr:transporter substrate-binding domain-containing protein [Gammaproteobacteria bacterium]NIV52286.1 transporter substrate-binding domain-containing protein [Gammaproteobacteria bacterium]
LILAGLAAAPGRPRSIPTLEGLSEPFRRRLNHALSAVVPYSNRLEQVRRSGVLRIGTTGDYPPFSHRVADDGPLSGADVDLGRLLAQALGAEARFVPTSWPTLME